MCFVLIIQYLQAGFLLLNINHNVIFNGFTVSDFPGTFQLYLQAVNLTV